MKYKITLRMGDYVAHTETDDIAEGLMKLKPEKLTYYVIIKVEGNGKSVERILKVWRARQVFANKRACEFFVKALILGI